MGEAERGEAAPRVRVPFYCANLHEVVPSFASEALVPDEWDCPRCGFPAGKDKANPPSPPRTESLPPWANNLSASPSPAPSSSASTRPTTPRSSAGAAGFAPC